MKSEYPVRRTWPSKTFDRLRLIKLGVRKEKETADMVRLMLRVIYQAANAKLKVAARDITYFDVRTGEALSGELSDSHLANTIEGGCRVSRKCSM